MKQTIFVKTLMGIFCIPLICSCVDNERDLFQEPEKIPKEQFFAHLPQPIQNSGLMWN